MLRPVQSHNDVMNFIRAVAIRSRIAKSCMRCRGICKGVSQDGGQADFYKKKTFTPLTLVNGISNEPTFVRIHLTGQYIPLIPLHFWQKYKDVLHQYCYYDGGDQAHLFLRPT